MLTKKQAEYFFFGGTIISFVIFLGLTWHTMSATVPDQTNDQNIDEKVIQGKHYAPELTKVYDRQGPAVIKSIMMSPVPWGPRGRQMVAYSMTEDEAEAIIAFFKWVGEIDLNGFPPEPDLKPSK